MASRDLKSPTGVTMRVETCTEDTSLLYLEIGDDNSEGGYGYLDAADRQWLRDELLKWDLADAMLDQRSLRDRILAPNTLVANHSLQYCKGCVHDTYKPNGSQLCTLYHIATNIACVRKVERKPTP
jgi:hypothetical protein